jgi:hypothetical protein
MGLFGMRAPDAIGQGNHSSGGQGRSRWVAVVSLAEAGPRPLFSIYGGCAWGAWGARRRSDLGRLACSMKGFLLGLIVAAIAVAGYLYWKEHAAMLEARPTVAADAGVQAARPVKEKRRRRRGAHLVRASSSSSSSSSPVADRGRGESAPPLEPEPEPVKLSPVDLKLVAQGDDLSRPDVQRFDMSDDSGTHELSKDEIDDRFRARQDDVLACISRARPDEETYVPGRVTVKFRIQRAGTVRGVKVEAPAILMKGGLYGCLKSVVGGIRFPPSNSSQILSYPFSLS